MVLSQNVYIDGDKSEVIFKLSLQDLVTSISNYKVETTKIFVTTTIEVLNEYIFILLRNSYLSSEVKLVWV